MYKTNGSNRWMSLQGLAKLMGIAGRAPFIINHDCPPTRALNVFNHATAENAVTHHDDIIAGLNHVDKA